MSGVPRRRRRRGVRGPADARLTPRRCGATTRNARRAALSGSGSGSCPWRARRAVAGWRGRRGSDEAGADRRAWLRAPARGPRRRGAGDSTGSAAFQEAARDRRPSRTRSRDLRPARPGPRADRSRRGHHGVALLDEAMVAVDRRRRVADRRRARLLRRHRDVPPDLRPAPGPGVDGGAGAWCEAQPTSSPFRGQCLVLPGRPDQLNGAWPEALDEAERASSAVAAAADRRPARPRTAGPSCTGSGARPSRPRTPTARPTGTAGCRSRASRCCGWPRAAGAPRLGDPPAAEESTRPGRRARLLAAHVEIALAAGDVAGAGAAADELAAARRRARHAAARAWRRRRRGAVLLAEGDATAGSPCCGGRSAAWRGSRRPTRRRGCVLVALACHAARRRGQRGAGARRRRRRFRRSRRRAGPRAGSRRGEAAVDRRAGAAGGLTARELEVLELVATGGPTGPSPPTGHQREDRRPARGNIFTKLGVSSRPPPRPTPTSTDLVAPST